MEQYFSELDLESIKEEEKIQQLFKDEVDKEIKENDTEYKCICIYTDIISYLENNGMIDLCKNLTIEDIENVMTVFRNRQLII
jgi:hypothetical protein